MIKEPLSSQLDFIADLVNPALVVCLLVALWLEKRAGKPRNFSGFFGRLALALGCGWLVTHPDRFLRGWGETMPDMSGHTAFAVAVAFAICLVNRRALLPLAAVLLGYAALMVAVEHHTWLEIGITAPLAAALTWLCFGGLARRAASPLAPSQRVRREVLVGEAE